MRIMNIVNYSCILSSCIFVTSCSNTGFIGHRVGYDINSEIKSDLSAPIAMNVGFESHSGAAIPPEKSLSLGELGKTGSIAEGEILPTISRLSIQKNTGTTGTEHDYVTVTATGDAAVFATRNNNKNMVEDVKNANSSKVSDVATKIATDPESIPK